MSKIGYGQKKTTCKTVKKSLNKKERVILFVENRHRKDWWYAF